MFKGAKNSTAGAELFAANCAACHGEKGVGEPSLGGGPPLNNAITLYKGTLDAIIAQVTSPRHGQMPAWSKRLDEATIKELAVYVYSLGGGQ